MESLIKYYLLGCHDSRSLGFRRSCLLLPTSFILTLVSAQLYSREKLILIFEAMEQHVFLVLWHANTSWRIYGTIHSKTVQILPITASVFREEMRKMVVCFPALLFDSLFINKSILRDLSVMYLSVIYMISRKVCNSFITDPNMYRFGKSASSVASAVQTDNSLELEFSQTPICYFSQYDDGLDYCA